MVSNYLEMVVDVHHAKNEHPKIFSTAHTFLSLEMVSKNKSQNINNSKKTLVDVRYLNSSWSEK